MPSKSASLGVAGGSAFLGLLGLVATRREFQHASQVAAEDTEGLVAGFATKRLIAEGTYASPSECPLTADGTRELAVA